MSSDDARPVTSRVIGNGPLCSLTRRRCRAGDAARLEEPRVDSPRGARRDGEVLVAERSDDQATAARAATPVPPSASGNGGGGGGGGGSPSSIAAPQISL